MSWYESVLTELIFVSTLTSLSFIIISLIVLLYLSLRLTPLGLRELKDIPRGGMENTKDKKEHARGGGVYYERLIPESQCQDPKIPWVTICLTFSHMVFLIFSLFTPFYCSFFELWMRRNNGRIENRKLKPFMSPRIITPEHWEPVTDSYMEVRIYFLFHLLLTPVYLLVIKLL